MVNIVCRVSDSRVSDTWVLSHRRQCQIPDTGREGVGYTTVACVRYATQPHALGPGGISVGYLTVGRRSGLVPVYASEVPQGAGQHRKRG